MVKPSPSEFFKLIRIAEGTHCYMNEEQTEETAQKIVRKKIQANIKNWPSISIECQNERHGACTGQIETATIIRCQCLVCNH